MGMLLMMATTVAQPVKLNASIVDSQQRNSIATSSQSAQKKAIITYLATKYKKPEAMVQRIVYSAFSEASAFGISPLLVLAMVEKESGLRHDVVNGYGAVGLMQVVPRFHKDKLAGMPVSSLKTPEVNIKVGIKVLKESIDNQGGNLEKGLKQYSGGSSQYKPKVMRFKRQLEEIALAGIELRGHPTH